MKKNNKFKAALLTILPLLVAFGLQLLLALIGSVIFNLYIIAYDKAHGIEWYIDTATMTYVNFYTDTQYSTYVTILTVISELAMLVCGAIWYKKIQKTECGIKASLKPFVVLFALVFGIGLQGVTSFLLNIIYNVYPDAWTKSYDELMNTMLDTTSPLMVISVALLAPIAEELFFRGIMLNYGKRCFPPIVALLAQAIAFGILHGNAVQFTYATIIGILLGLIALEFKSVWPGIVVHIGVNTSAEVLSFLEVDISVLLMTLTGAILCVIAVAGYFIYKNKKVVDKIQ